MRERGCRVTAVQVCYENEGCHSITQVFPPLKSIHCLRYFSTSMHMYYRILNQAFSTPSGVPLVHNRDYSASAVITPIRYCIGTSIQCQPAL